VGIVLGLPLFGVIAPRVRSGPEKSDYTEELLAAALDKLRFRPGCLSLILIHGRNELSWLARNELNIAYVRTFSRSRREDIGPRPLDDVRKPKRAVFAGETCGTRDPFLARETTRRDGSPPNFM
jgi:hypothetical protein